MNPKLFTWAALLTLTMTCMPVVEGEEASYLITDHAVCAPDGLALGGYDVVSYFVDGPQIGSAEYAHPYEGLSYHFASAAHLARFKATPERYLPKYRGWCSATLAMGRLACPDFTNYKIENGQLLLFERIGFANGLDMWNADPVTAGQNADSHYQRLLRAAKSSFLE